MLMYAYMVIQDYI